MPYPIQRNMNQEQPQFIEGLAANAATHLSFSQMTSKDIIIINDHTDSSFIINNIPICMNNKNEILIQDLIDFLKFQRNLPLDKTLLFFYSNQMEMFVYVGQDPFLVSKTLPLSFFGQNQPIKFKYRVDTRQSNEESKRDQCGGYNSNRYVSKNENNTQMKRENLKMEEEDSQNQDFKQIPREKRVKEREISYVQEKVQEWRRYYDQGILDSNNKIIKINLDSAAGMVGLSRKTLDDYYKVIRKAEKLGFDFRKYGNKKMGYLRSFVNKKNNEKKVKVTPASPNDSYLEDDTPEQIANIYNRKNYPGQQQFQMSGQVPFIPDTNEQFDQKQQNDSNTNQNSNEQQENDNNMRSDEDIMGKVEFEGFQMVSDNDNKADQQQYEEQYEQIDYSNVNNAAIYTEDIPEFLFTQQLSFRHMRSFEVPSPTHRDYVNNNENNFGYNYFDDQASSYM